MFQKLYYFTTTSTSPTMIIDSLSLTPPYKLPSVLCEPLINFWVWQVSVKCSLTNSRWSTGPLDPKLLLWLCLSLGSYNPLLGLFPLLCRPGYHTGTGHELEPGCICRGQHLLGFLIFLTEVGISFTLALATFLGLDTRSVARLSSSRSQSRSRSSPQQRLSCN